MVLIPFRSIYLIPAFLRNSELMHQKRYNSRGFKKLRRGFTLIELVMVILLLAILAAIAIPNFIDFRTDAKNSATSGAIGALRAAIVVATSAIDLKEDPSSAHFPNIRRSSRCRQISFLRHLPAATRYSPR